MTQRNRPSRTITLAPDLWERLDLDARTANLSVSQLIESHLREYYQGVSTLRLDRIETTLHDFRASVIPVVTKVAQYLQELEGEGAGPTKGDGQPPKIVSYEEMYGPITRTPAPDPPPAPVEPPPRRRWPWQG
jgi:hypothetical protein